jgi:putative DNA methylase
MERKFHFQPKGLKSNLGWYDRGYIPHFEGGEIPQFITFRLSDSLPQKVLNRWRTEMEELGEAGKTLFRKNIEKYLDQGHGACYLRDSKIAGIVQDGLLFLHGKKYRLIAWVIMPNHVHFLAIPVNGVELGKLTHSLKSYTAHEANKVLGRVGQFWQHESFDRYIRNHKHFDNVIRYIEMNPVKAGLCRKAEDWGSQAQDSVRTKMNNLRHL